MLWGKKTTTPYGREFFNSRHNWLLWVLGRPGREGTKRQRQSPQLLGVCVLLCTSAHAWHTVGAQQTPAKQTQLGRYVLCTGAEPEDRERPSSEHIVQAVNTPETRSPPHPAGGPQPPDDVSAWAGARAPVSYASPVFIDHQGALLAPWAVHLSQAVILSPKGGGQRKSARS